MDVEIRFNRAAFRHKATKADILRAFETFIYEDPIEDADNKYLLLGFNVHGNLIEVMYNRINEDAVNVFHANLENRIEHETKFHEMPCRKVFRDMIG